jgi:uncharacterized protein GlcG (DUF336 family)
VNLALAQKVIDAAVQGAERLSTPPMSVVVVDAGGHVVAAARMDGAGFLTAEVARSKAFTAVGTGIPTATVQEALKDNPHLVAAFAASTQTRFLAAPGGIPIEVDGEVVGAIGASGGRGEQDLAVAEAGIAAAEGK